MVSFRNRSIDGVLLWEKNAAGRPRFNKLVRYDRRAAEAVFTTGAPVVQALDLRTGTTQLLQGTRDLLRQRCVQQIRVLLAEIVPELCEDESRAEAELRAPRRLRLPRTK
jgi:hypothetical protein